MSASSRSRSSAPVLPMTSDENQPMSPSNRFYTSAFSSPAASSSFSARTDEFSRSVSPNRVRLIGSSLSTPSVRFSIDRSCSSSRSISAVTSRDSVIRPSFSSPGRRKTCMCSPTTHPGSFRCGLHKGLNRHPLASLSSPPNRLNARRSAMTNSLVRIATVEGELVKRALAALIRPSSHHQRRRADFHPRPSRLSNMSMADNL